jgi:hypothetical protein
VDIHRLRLVRILHDVQIQGELLGKLDSARRNIGAAELAMRACILPSRPRGAMFLRESFSSESFSTRPKVLKRLLIQHRNSTTLHRYVFHHFQYQVCRLHVFGHSMHKNTKLIAMNTTSLQQANVLGALACP